MIMTTIQSRLRDKALSKMHMLNIEIRDLENDIKYSTDQNLFSTEVLLAMLQDTKTELEVWNYIAELVEKDI
jgi:hypothetical protein